MSVEITRLPNGINVVTHHMPHLETVALGIWVKAGARDERAEENGIAHFLEHMAFKGTTRRTARAIAEEIESAGGEINAATGMETTTYYARVLKNDWAAGPRHSGRYLHRRRNSMPDELERERDVILQEIAAANDQPDDLVFDLAQAASFGDHPLGRSILGTHDLIGDRHARPDPRLAQPQLLGLAHGRGRRRQHRSSRLRRRGRAPARPHRKRPAAAARPAGHSSPICLHRREAARPGPSGVDLRGAELPRSGYLCAAGAVQHSGRRHVVPPVPGGAREARPLLQRLLLWLGL